MRIAGLLAWQSWDWGALLLRLVLGTIMLAHGGQKAFGAFGGGGPAGTVEMVEGLGFQPAGLWAALLILAEAVGGLLVLLGVVTELAALAIAIDMLVAIWKVHWQYGFFNHGAGGTGIEFTLALFAMATALILGGPGRWALWDPFRQA
ncbi:MAG: DoxX family protein [Armatimonadetes bacterium]|nr:DoxX family protein [Armatimonadota bacterium]